MPAPGGNRDRLLAEAMEHHQAGRLDEADGLYRRMIEAWPDDPGALHLSGVLAHHRGDNPAAADLIAGAIRADESVAQFHNDLGLVRSAMGRPDLGITHFRDALVLDPEHREAQLDLGRALRAAGRNEEAVAHFREIAARGDDPATLLGLARALRSLDRLDEAVAALRQAIRLDARQGDAQALLGIILLDRSEPQEALRCFRAALAVQPDDAATHNNLGKALRQTGDVDGAVAEYRRATSLNPGEAGFHVNLGNALRVKGDMEAAARAFWKAHEIDGKQAAALSGLATILDEQELTEEAVALFRKALSADPDLLDAHANLGNALRKLGRSEEALEPYLRALSIAPGSADILSNYGAGLNDLNRSEEAEAALERALALSPDHAQALNNLGIVRRRQDRPKEAVQCYRRALDARPAFVEAYSNMTVAYQDQGRVRETISAYRQALAIDPDNAEAHAYLGMTLLLSGDFEAGWEEYEWRWRCKEWDGQRPEVDAPPWDGAPLEGRTILLHDEQGLGDALQFVRFAPLVAARGGVVVLQCQAPLVGLLGTVPGVERVVPRGTSLRGIDTHASLLSLPRLFGTTPDNVPHDVPYITPPGGDRRVVEVIKDAEGRRRVGIAWAGNPGHINDRRRSCPPAHFGALAEVADVALFSLQKDRRTGDVPPEQPLFDLAPLLGDFSDTAAAMTHLDLVITADTSVAHLAGAMGRPVWVLLPFAPDWRWMLGREDSPWYPTLRLFRQDRPGDWEGVFRRVEAALRAAG